jgi:hypothetical protein
VLYSQQSAPVYVSQQPAIQFCICLIKKATEERAFINKAIEEAAFKNEKR